MVKRLKYKILGVLILISAVAGIPFFVGGTAKSELEVTTYVGTLEKGNSVMHFGGEPTVELTFEDGRTFTAPEHMATEAEMKVGGSYQITFNQEKSEMALSITEVF